MKSLSLLAGTTVEAEIFYTITQLLRPLNYLRKNRVNYLYCDVFDKNKKADLHQFSQLSDSDCTLVYSPLAHNSRELELLIIEHT